MVRYHGDNIITSLECVTPETAERYLKLCAFAHQRPVRINRVNEYAEYMRKGEWQALSVLQFAVVGNTQYLLDGQHRLQAVIASQHPQTFLIVSERMESAERAALRYAAIDTGMNRTVGDAMRVLGLAEEVDIAESYLRYIDAAAKFLVAGCEDAKIHSSRRDQYMAKSRTAIAERIREWAPYARRYMQCYEGKRNWSRGIFVPIVSRAFFAIGLATFRYQPLKAQMFWSAVMRGEGLTANSPEYQCRELAVERLGSRGTRGDAVLTARRVAACWNYFFDDKAFMDKVRARREDLPIFIAGTPWKG